MADYSFVFNADPRFVDSLYQKYLTNPSEIEDGWRSFFYGFEFGQNTNGYAGERGIATTPDPHHIKKLFDVLSIIHGYRDRGHLLSKTNPIRSRRDRKPHLDLNDYHLEESDLDKPFVTGAEIGMPNATLSEILNRLNQVYCGHIGFEFAHIESRERRMWLRERIESHNPQNHFDLPIDKKRRILEKLNGAVVFENFLNKKYVGQKRFSLEGGESTIPALDFIINKGAELGVEEVVMGMAHRGRLNVLANIMGKTYDLIFNEFEGTAIPNLSFGDGDVKYHLGFSSLVKSPDGKEVHLKLVPNPSHLESVNPVVEGFSRAKADLLYDNNYGKILPILIHGDAAIAGQGVVYETIQMSQLKGYHTGGTIHLVINNQIGFTTDFDDARSATYCTSIGSMIQAPVFHVNGDDPEAVVFAVELATEYRQTFKTDVFIDIVCYRRHGHNEGDDPQFTQPEMYNFIKNHLNPRELYVKQLLSRGVVDQKMAEDLESTFWDDLQARLDSVKQKPLPYSYQEPELQWKELKKSTSPADYEKSPITGVDKKSLEKAINHLLSNPEGLTPLGKIARLQKSKKEMVDNNQLDWGWGELLAYATILMKGHDVRLSGQDVKRGTFSHRHAIFNDAKTFKEYNRLDGLSPDQGKFRIFNSLLSEFAVLGFEYGYSLATPHSLVIWEAQFGDFYNGAQTIVDQYITAAESKWQRMSGLVMLLPHGYAGQGPEHSSARLERFLQAGAEFNITVANITTPANFFHALRRQLARPFRKPLIVMSPKSLLRHPLCVSKIEDFTGKTAFAELIDDNYADPKKVKKLLLCSGKVYFDLLEKQQNDKRKDVAIVRLEQLYPLPQKQLEAVFKKYASAQTIWVQEEPMNMGAWQYLYCTLRNPALEVISRKAGASPATGFKKVHDDQQADIVERAFS